MTTYRYDWKQLRTARGWTQSQVMHRLCQRALAAGTRLPSVESLKRMLSAWENGQRVPSVFYVDLLRQVYELAVPTHPAGTPPHRLHRNSDVFARVLGSTSVPPVRAA